MLTGREKELTTILRNANIAWNTFKPIYTDAEYHTLWKELYDINPNNPELYHTSRDPSIGHNHVVHRRFIPGTQKAFDMLDLVPFLTRYADKPLVVEPKYDGVAVMVYVSGDDKRVVLHGDGKQGRDVSYHPWNLEEFTASGAFSAEAIIPCSLWDKSMGSNPRNTVAGWINREAPCVSITAKVVLIEHNSTVKRTIFPDERQHLEDILLECYVSWKKVFPMDGLMLKVADPMLRVQVAFTDLYYNWSIAWKPPIQSAWTTVENVEWNVSRNGRVFPTVVYSQIELCQTKNTRASGLHAKYIDTEKIRLGSKILVGKAGEIIPKILSVNNDACTEEYVPLQECPICRESLSWEGVNLMCTNPECMPQMVKKIAYLYSQPALNIIGIGKSTVEDILQAPVVRKFLVEKPWMLLAIPHHEALRTHVTHTIGETRTANLIEAINNSSGTRNEAHFIAGLSHEFLGYKKALAFLQFLRYNEPLKRMSDDLQHKMLIALQQLRTAREDLAEYCILQVPCPARVNYVITGTLSTPRTDIVEYLSSYQWNMQSYVSKHTDYLILGELKKPSEKLKRAEELGITIIGEHQLLDLLPRKGDRDENSNT